MRALVVPGSQRVREAAMHKGLHRIFEEAGFEWREPGCSMCLGMNPDQVPEGEHCASTSNRNFEGRQGKGARTHLVSPRWRLLRYMVILLILERRVMMEPFRIHKGTAAVLMNDNIDTDQIIRSNI